MSPYKHLLDLAAVAIMVALPASASAQVTPLGSDRAASHPGAMSVLAGEQLGRDIASPTARHAAFSAADAIVAVLRRDAAIARPVGYSVSLIPVAGTTTLTAGDSDIVGGVVFGLRGSLNYFGVADDGTINDQGGIVPFSVIVNAPGRLTDADELPLARDHGPSVLGNIRQTGEFRGHPIYNGECVVVSGHAAPPFVPLTMERYYTLVMAGYRSDSLRHAVQRRADDAQTEALLKNPGITPEQAATMRAVMRQGPIQEGQRLQELRGKLNALSAAERQAPTAVIIHGVAWDFHGDDLADITDTSSSPLVQLNPAFMDRTRPATAPQIITICIPGVQGLENMAYDDLAGPERDTEKARLEKLTRDAVLIRDHLDWAALEALVKQ